MNTLLYKEYELRFVDDSSKILILEENGSFRINVYNLGNNFYSLPCPNLDYAIHLSQNPDILLPILLKTTMNNIIKFFGNYTLNETNSFLK